MIRGRFVRGRPYIACRVELPRLGVAATIPLLVDTGADHTCIHPKDGPAFSIPYEQLDRPTGVIGVAGRSARYIEDAILNFRSSTHGTIHHYRLPVRVGKPEDVDQRLPSLLGQDILRHWQTVHEPATGRLEFLVLDAGTAER